MLCARAMLLEWTDGAGTKHMWRSCDDTVQCGWYETEKLLPPTTTNISVRFQVRGFHREVQFAGSTGSKEELLFRVEHSDSCAPIDAVFELQGPIHKCCVNRAWNAARCGEPEDWEHWPEDGSRPAREEAPVCLKVANMAVPPQRFFDPQAFLDACTERLLIAMKVLLGVHQKTLRALHGLNNACTGQWYLSNLGSTVSAGLMIAAVPATFVLPPVGVGLAAAGSVAGGVTVGGDMLRDRWSLAELHKQVSADSWNAFVVSELFRDWLRASAVLQQLHASDGSSCRRSEGIVHEGMFDLSTSGDQLSPEDTLKVAGVAAVAVGDDVLTVALPVLGPLGFVLGAVLTTGMAMHGWTSQRLSQTEVQGKIAELKNKVLLLNFLLARMGKLTCPICEEALSEDEPARRCNEQEHVFHARCQDKSASCCSICPGLLYTGSLATWVQELATAKAAEAIAESTSDPSRLAQLQERFSKHVDEARCQLRKRSGPGVAKVTQGFQQFLNEVQSKYGQPQDLSAPATEQAAPSTMETREGSSTRMAATTFGARVKEGLQNIWDNAKHKHRQNRERASQDQTCDQPAPALDPMGAALGSTANRVVSRPAQKVKHLAV
eukprot:TRINITY_DN3917_c0_g1_i1.p1 TRINITY_DN3917_c0_g1~~TRINITY_DN3917_c0_g1_i1.p1  ORF type:complete len:686 (-),score=139.10 TRINITY_DN3917_c0_g1_i1:204-2024(-)